MLPYRLGITCCLVFFMPVIILESVFVLTKDPLLQPTDDGSYDNFIVTMSVPSRTLCPALWVENEDIRFLTEREWGQESFHGNDNMGVIWFLNK